ncbi:hypothetical protein MKX03_009349 [Papaver bracteatum]|nr:hypothetical protein MKX03_009349 [Papaver bracteatum]
MNLESSSLVVPSVQELVKGKITKIPQRYIRTDSTSTSLEHDSDSMAKYTIPVINIERLLSGESVSADSELEKLHSACKDWGFFQVVNHGISSSVVEKIKLETHNLFELPFEEKNKLRQKPGEQEGFGQLFVVSDDQKLDWADLLFITTLPIEMRKPHLFDGIPLPLRESLEAYSVGLKTLTMNLLGKMAKALKMDYGEIGELFNDCSQRMRLNYYPPCPMSEKVLGLSPHSDGGGLTILLQLNETEGLQIRKDDNWLPVKPIPDGFVVNIGDMMEILSNGVYHSIEHRVLIHPTKERLSIAAFHAARQDAVIGPALSLIDPPNKPALFRKETVKEYYENFYARKLDGKSNLHCMRIQNGHDDHSS